MYGLIYRFGQFDGFIYGFLAVASLCASVASDGDSDVQIYRFFLAHNLFIKKQIISIAKCIRLEEP